jgi:hypothetical protein
MGEVSHIEIEVHLVCIGYRKLLPNASLVVVDSET